MIFYTDSLLDVCELPMNDALAFAHQPLCRTKVFFVTISFIISINNLSYYLYNNSTAI